MTRRTPLLTALLALVGWLTSVLRRGASPSAAGPVPGARTVRTEDGVDLHVAVDEGPEPTVDLVHGFTARLEEFLLQRETLQGRARVVRRR